MFLQIVVGLMLGYAIVSLLESLIHRVIYLRDLEPVGSGHNIHGSVHPSGTPTSPMASSIIDGPFVEIS